MVRNFILDCFRICKISILFFFYLVVRLVPVKKGQISFICNEAGTFGGNIGPLVRWCAQKKLQNYKVLSSSPLVVQSLKKKNIPTLLYGKFSAFFYLLRSEKVIIECGMPLLSCVICAHKEVYQMWHGANLKFMVKQWDELRDMSDHSWPQKFLRWMHVNIPKYEFILATSEFYAKNTFEKSFNSKRVFVSGYPRCDVFFRDLEKLDFISLDTELYEKVKNHPGKVLAYVPTWRDNANEEEIFPFDREKLKTFLEENNLLMIVKKHHRDKRAGFKEAGERVILFPADNDIYPLFSEVDVLISDYSSIFFDYLLLNKPVVFYTYDYQTYVTRDRAFQYDYDDFTPGVKCREEDELYSEVLKAIGSNEYYLAERERVKKIVFGERIEKNASQMIMREILK